MSKASLFERMAKAYSKRSHAVRDADEIMRKLGDLEDFA